MTRLRKLMLDELQRRNYAQKTVRAYVHAIEDFAKHFHRSPDRLGPAPACFAASATAVQTIFSVMGTFAARYASGRFGAAP